VTVVQDTVAHTISVSCDDDISSLYFVFSGEVEPIGIYPEHLFNWEYDSVFTRMFRIPELGSDPLSTLIDDGVLFSYTGEGRFLTAEAAYDGEIQHLVIIEGGCCWCRGNINRDPEGVIDISDLVYLVNFMFKAGEEPPCMDDANIDGVGQEIDISDLVHFVNFMFKDGPSPVDCSEELRR